MYDNLPSNIARNINNLFEYFLNGVFVSDSDNMSLSHSNLLGIQVDEAEVLKVRTETDKRKSADSAKIHSMFINKCS